MGEAEEPIQIHIPADLQSYNVSLPVLLSSRPNAQALAAGAFVFAHAPESKTPRLLLIQREAKDGSLAGKWEIPGGGCETSDPTIFHSAARELYEEAGLHMTRVLAKVGKDNVFNTRSGLRVAKLSFEVVVREEANGGVPLAQIPVELSDEHQAFAWVSEEELDNRRFPITHPEQKLAIVEAFRGHTARKEQET